MELTFGALQLRAARRPHLLAAYAATISGLTNNATYGPVAEEGAALSITVTGLTGGETVSFRWQENGVDIFGAAALVFTPSIGVNCTNLGALRGVATVNGTDVASAVAIVRRAPPAVTAAIGDRLDRIAVAIAPVDLTAGLTGSGISHALAPASAPLPSGLSLDPGVGQITGTPTALISQPGIVARAQNSGGSVDRVFKMSVGDVPAQMAAPGAVGTAADQIAVTLPADPADNNGPISGYDLQWSVDQVAWTIVPDALSGHVIAGLAAGTLHYVQVRAKNTFGPGAWSGSASATTAGTGTAPEITALTAGAQNAETQPISFDLSEAADVDWVLSADPTSPTPTQVALGQDALGDPGADSGTIAIPAGGVTSLWVPLIAGLDGNFHLHLSPVNSGGVRSAEVDSTGPLALDTVAPVLTAASDAGSGSTTADGNVTTDTGTGTLFWVATGSATAPSAAQIEAGQDDQGQAAARAGQQPVTQSGLQTVSVTGLGPASAYHLHFMHKDVSGNRSAVASGDGFATASGLPAPVAVSFDGANDYLERGSGLLAAADDALLSGYVRFATTLGGVVVNSELNTRLRVRVEASGKLSLYFKDPAGVNIVAAETLSALNDGADHEVWFAYDGGTGQLQIYADGVADQSIVVLTAGTVDMTRSVWNIGADPGGANKFSGTLTRVCLWKGVALDCANASTRAAMADETQALVLGDNFIDFFGAASDWNGGTNFGSGGGFVMNGAVI